MSSLHLVKRALFGLIENISQEHDVALACTHAINTTKLDMELIQRPVGRPAVSQMDERT